jgi:thiopeptide-type bacteriocin biosynthesis protein
MKTIISYPLLNTKTPLYLHIMKQEEWISVHLFYDDSLNFFLKKAVQPFLKLNKAYILSSFFIRYMENGQHVRLRVLIDRKHTPILIEKINLHFNNFFTNFPSKHQIKNTTNFPNNAIQHIAYEPEIQRYGGTEGILISEQLFHYSSKTILNLIEAETEYEQALLIGIIMNLYLAKSDPKHNISNLFQSIFNYWLDYNCHYLNLSKTEIIQRYESIYDEQSEMFTEIIEGILSEKGAGEAEIEGLENWKKYCTEILKKLRNTGLTKLIPEIIGSYIHMNNNRLGISNFDESLMAYLILREITLNPSTEETGFY